MYECVHIVLFVFVCLLSVCVVADILEVFVCALRYLEVVWMCVHQTFMYVCLSTWSNVLAAHNADGISFHFLASTQ